MLNKMKYSFENQLRILYRLFFDKFLGLDCIDTLNTGKHADLQQIVARLTHVTLPVSHKQGRENR